MAVFSPQHRWWMQWTQAFLPEAQMAVSLGAWTFQCHSFRHLGSKQVELQQAAELSLVGGSREARRAAFQDATEELSKR